MFSIEDRNHVRDHVLQLAKTDERVVAGAVVGSLALSDGDRVKVRSETGEIEVAVVAAKGDELPPGVLFIAYGDLSSQLMGGDTHGTGIPTSKGLDVVVEKVAP